MDFDLIERTITGGHHQVKLSNDEKPNPINRQVHRELAEVLDDVESDDSAAVLSILGDDGTFAVGADIAEMHEWFVDGRWDELMRFIRQGQELTVRVDDLDVVTIAGINGYALGGGLELALACDFRFAASSALVGFPEIELGMIPGWGGTQRLPDIVGKSTAKDLLLTGRQVPADEALDIGLVDEVVPDGDLDDEVASYAERLVENPLPTMRYMLDAVETGADAPLATGLSYELMCDMFACFTDETAARVDNFLER